MLLQAKARQIFGGARQEAPENCPPPAPTSHEKRPKPETVPSGRIDRPARGASSEAEQRSADGREVMSRRQKLLGREIGKE